MKWFWSGKISESNWVTWHWSNCGTHGYSKLNSNQKRSYWTNYFLSKRKSCPSKPLKTHTYFICNNFFEWHFVQKKLGVPISPRAFDFNSKSALSQAEMSRSRKNHHFWSVRFINQLKQLIETKDCTSFLLKTIYLVAFKSFPRHTLLHFYSRFGLSSVFYI